MAPAAAIPAETKFAAWKPWKKAEVAALWTAAASAGWPAWTSLSTAVSAPPMDAWALCAIVAGSWTGIALVSRLAGYYCLENKAKLEAETKL